MAARQPLARSVGNPTASGKYNTACLPPARRSQFEREDLQFLYDLQKWTSFEKAHRFKISRSVIDCSPVLGAYQEKAQSQWMELLGDISDSKEAAQTSGQGSWVLSSLALRFEI